MTSTTIEPTLIFTEAALDELEITVTPESDAPPHVTLFGSPTIGLLHVAGPAEATGMVAIWACDKDGFDYAPIPEPEAAFIIRGLLRLTPTDGDSFDVKAGEGYRLPAGWSGRLEAVQPVLKTYFLL